jgi:hypothetical protein
LVKSSKDAAVSNKGLDETSKVHAMSDLTYAQELLQEAFPIRAGRNIKAAIGEAFAALSQRENGLPGEMFADRERRRWTERRVRAIWQREARRIDHYEIEDLTAIAAVQEAKRELERSKARQRRLATLLADPMAHSGRELADLVRQRVGGMDRP